MKILIALAMLAGSFEQPRVQGDGKPCDLVDGGSHVLTTPMRAVLASQYRSWAVRRQCKSEPSVLRLDPQGASVASGDYDADGRVDQAVLLDQTFTYRLDS